MKRMIVVPSKFSCVDEDCRSSNLRMGEVSRSRPIAATAMDVRVEEKQQNRLWVALGCLCQQDVRKDLRCPYEKECHPKVYEVLEVDLKKFVDNEVPMPLDANVECLDNGSGIANTMKTNQATYQNGYRVLYHSGTAVSPKKTRLSYKATLDREKTQYVYFEKYEGEGDEQIYRVSSALRMGATISELGSTCTLNTASNAEDAQVSDIHYHASCYTKLKTEARAATKSSRSTFH
ncbi:hypothetical protein FQA39_LY05527 [Lamprigera yunnana]|nr:hypothetical protein FQA39_LY05527 [Lamprigera yunnana]